VGEKASWSRRAIAGASVAACLFASRAAAAEPTPAGELRPSAVTLAPYFPRRVFARRSTALMVLATVFASTGATVAAAGGAVYGQAHDSCLEGHQQNTQNLGHFCYAQRSQFDAGMGMMVVGGTVFAIGLPLAVWAGSGAPTDERRAVGLRVGPSGAAVVGSF
jgi:hypothetical protein